MSQTYHCDLGFGNDLLRSADFVRGKVLPLGRNQSAVENRQLEMLAADTRLAG